MALLQPPMNVMRTTLLIGVLSLSVGGAVFAQQPQENSPRKLYLLAATLTMPELPAGYPVTLYQASGGKLKLVREVLPPGPHGGANVSEEGRAAPTALCCVLVSENALYVLYPYYNSTTVSVIHFADPARSDEISFNTENGFTNTPILLLVPRSASEDELEIPIITGELPNQSGSLTSILVSPNGAQVKPNSDAWNDYSGFESQGLVGGPARQSGPWGVTEGGDLVSSRAGSASFFGHKVMLDALGSYPGPRGMLFVWAANKKYLLLSAIRTNGQVASSTADDTLHGFEQDRTRNQWKPIQLEGNASRPRLFGDWLASVVASWNIKGPAAGRENERADGTDRLPNVKRMYESAGRPLAMPGVLTLQNLADGRKIRIVTGQEDSEIVDVTKDTVLYRVNNSIYQAEIQGDKLQQAILVAHDEDVPEVHWAFWSNQN